MNAHHGKMPVRKGYQNSDINLRPRGFRTLMVTAGRRMREESPDRPGFLPWRVLRLARTQ